MHFSSLCALAYALSTKDAWFPALAFAFPAMASSIQKMSVLISSFFRIQYRTHSSVLHAFALLKTFPKHSLYLGPPAVAPF